MGNCNDIDKILKRNGVSQAQRFLEQLDPDNFELQDFDVEDWVLFTYNFAQYVNFYETSSNKEIAGDWQDFFDAFGFEFDTNTVEFRTSRKYSKAKEKITEAIAAFKEKGDLTPHLTLFICFLYLLEYSKTRFNGLTKRHLDFYYTEILKVDKLPATPDQVHVLLELAKKSVEEQIVTGTALNAKKDANGNQLTYTSDTELIANQAKVSSLKTIYYDKPLAEIKASGLANSFDGAEAPLPDGEPYWWPFGYTSAEDKEKFAALPDAQLGFALASPVLKLEEGDRKVVLTLEFENETTNAAFKLSDFNKHDLHKIISIHFSTKEKWSGPHKLDTADSVTTQVVDNNTLVFVFKLGKDDDKIIEYDDEFLLEHYNTAAPVVKFIINPESDITEKPLGHQFHQAIVNRILKRLHVRVEVNEAPSVLIENDNGVLKAKKPFFPFTSQPIRRSNFQIDYPEVFQKNWKRLSLNFAWKNTPEDFADWYSAYLQNSLPKNTSTAPIISDEAYFKATTAVGYKKDWQEISDTQELFTSKVADEDGNYLYYQCDVSINNNNFSKAQNKTDEIGKTGPVRLSLNQSFLHDLFPKLYAASLMGNTTSSITLDREEVPTAITTTTSEGNIPNTPYTPVAENITISYVAEEERIISSQAISSDPALEIAIAANNTSAAYEKDRLRLFHIHPFGQCEEHNYLETERRLRGIVDVYDSERANSYLLPNYCQGGELFIGLEQAVVQQNISLLVQVLEGSEDTEVPTFNDTEKVQWAVLCDNKWKSIQEDIISNSTDNFLRSGIITFGIPREATQNNTRLPEGYVWIRAKMHRAYNAVCKAINIHAQAVKATFVNNENELSHLDKSLPAETIKKLITRIPQVKGLEQPYNSFGGIAEESDLKFYRRISERLRHKNRAITLWDYEHMILQEFPEVFKAKCLNHTEIVDKEGNVVDNYVAAGEVSLVVIPDTANKNVFDTFQPRVSQGLINKIKTYINQYNTKHVTAKVINPVYEEVKVKLEVSFFEGLDESFYMKKLNDAIISFLSPWAFDNTSEIVFGVELHRSVLIDFMEKLSYVDYLQNVTIEKEGEVQGSLVSPSAPKSILVSAKSHAISTVLTTCKGNKEKTAITCQ